MKHILGLAFIGALFEKNLEVAIFIIAVVACLIVLEKLRNKKSFYDFKSQVLTKLGSDYIAIDLKRINCSDSVALICDSKKKDFHLISAIAYGVDRFKLENIDDPVSVTMIDYFGNNSVQPIANIEIRSPNFVGSYSVFELKNWKLLEKIFKISKES